MKKRVLELDYVRALSMLAIIALHASGPFAFSLSAARIFGLNLALIINQFMRFAVPSFIVLSGISLGYGKTEKTAQHFYSDRLMKAALPYIIWFCVYFAYNYFFESESSSPSDFLLGLITGAAAPHLYFMVIILQLYILFPALARLLEKHKTLTITGTFLLSFYFQLGIYIKYFGLHILPTFLENRGILLFPTWIFYFAMGIIISGRLDSVFTFAKKRFLLILIVSLLFGILLTIEGKAFNTFELSIRPQIFVYTILVMLLMSGLGAYGAKHEKLSKIALFLSKRSMTVYFVHILVLYAFKAIGLYQEGFSGMLLLFIFVTLLSLAAASLIDKALSALSRCFKSVREGSLSR